MNKKENIKMSKEKIQLVKGKFTPSEASQILLSLIEDKINFHNRQRIQLWEEDHDFKTDLQDARIVELNKEKLVVLEFLKNATKNGENVKINGILELSIF